jgi:hypothetical protein
MSLKKNTVSRQASIRAALTFLETQKTNSDPILSVRRVALEHGIAEQTLCDAVNRGGVPKRPGPPTILTANEENELVGYCLNMQKMGFGLIKAAVNTMIMQILAANNRTHPFKNGPGYKWWKRFMCDHSQLSFRVPQELSKARAAKGNPTVIQNHFITFKQLIHEHSLSRLAPSLATHQPIALSLKPIHAHDTRTNKIIQLEHENEKLHEYIQRLEHPGTISLASIMRYPYPKSISVEEKPQTRSKAFKFGTLVTAESIIKELEDKENAKKKKIEDIRLRKEQRIINKMAKKNKQNKSNNK